MNKTPVVTLGAAALLGAGLFIANVLQEAEPVAPAPVAAVETSTVQAAPAPVTETPAPQPNPAFPRTADYEADIPTRNGTIVLEISVDGSTATAYACDNVGIEEWLNGGAANGLVNLTSEDGDSRLEGSHTGNAIEGTLWVGEKQWEFVAPQVTDDSNA